MAAPTRLRHRVGRAIAVHRLWSAGDRVLVAVSGGMDSVALLDLLVRTADWHGGRLEVGTVDHGVHPHGPAHADHVATLAAAHGLPLHRFALGLGPDASEEQCRLARYGALEQVEADRIAVAHHREDQAETVLLQLLRGTGTRGLAGMAWQREQVVRPLLAIPRADLKAYAEARGLSWVEDPTNAEPRYLRNRVRAELLPLLEDLRAGAVEAVARSATLAALDADLLDALAASEPEAVPGEDGWSREWVAEAPEPYVRRALVAFLPGATAAHVDAVLEAAREGRGTVTLPGHREVRITRNRVVPDRL